jgi:hypothetical protein
MRSGLGGGRTALPAASVACYHQHYKQKYNGGGEADRNEFTDLMPYPVDVENDVRLRQSFPGIVTQIGIVIHRSLLSKVWPVRGLTSGQNLHSIANLVNQQKTLQIS